MVKVTQIVSGRAGFKPKRLAPESILFYSPVLILPPILIIMKFLQYSHSFDQCKDKKKNQRLQCLLRVKYTCREDEEARAEYYNKDKNL